MGFSCGDGFDKREAKVPLRPEIEEAEVQRGVDMQGGHGLELDLEFKPIEHPVEPSDEDRPVKCPMPGSSVSNVERLAESLRKRGEVSTDMNEEGMLVVAVEPPARAVRKRHHTLTRNHSIPPLLKRAPLPPLQTQNSTIFQMLQQCNEYDEPIQDMQY
ncbi:uncharacterized protein LOC122667876 isoform X2 [Telopea speciosissima]|uniref:uncharacterized protein LOC122667876 isoform X2 n=1 Tax=Telopea speciosissima TaxID=54955 RepID=UPI001CC3BACB|nr:uncharacterized protein LOC122667876 isoform X2 [Telopea speciosissima]